MLLNQKERLGLVMMSQVKRKSMTIKEASQSLRIVTGRVGEYTNAIRRKRIEDSCIGLKGSHPIEGRLIN